MQWPFQWKGVKEFGDAAGAEGLITEVGKGTPLGCFQCIIHCSNEFTDMAGKYVTSSLEYETIWSMDGMTDIADSSQDYHCTPVD